MDIVLGYSFRLSPTESGSRDRTCTCHSAAHGFIQNWSISPSQDVSKDSGLHGHPVPGNSVGPALHVDPSILAETSSSSPRLASRMPPCQGEPGLRHSSGPLERPSVDGMGRALGYHLQKQGGLNRRFQRRLGSAVRW